ncbi:MAG: peptidoglycan DD-metalloendopeptidase family protein [Ekhidna sp.]
MNEVIVYIIKVMAIHGLLYLFYKLLLRNTGRHVFNRGFLLLALVAAFFIPFIELSLPEEVQGQEEISVIMWLSEPATEIEEFDLVPVAKQTASSYWYIVPWLYGAIAFVLLIRSVFYLALLSRLKRNSEYVKKRWFKLFKISQDRPFSFFSNIFMPRSLFETEAFEQILAHECEHVRQFHSIDRLLTDFVVSLFWFNPFMYLYRNALIEIHEFQADEVVLNRFKDPVGYQEILFSQLQSAQYSGLVSHFNFSMIKKRIVMMNKQRKKSGWVYVLTAPVTLMVVFAFSSKEAIEPIEKVGNEIAELLEPEPNHGIFPIWDMSEPQGKTQIVNDVRSSVPSISPVRAADLKRLASGFGMRTHPIDKTRKFHKGVDFSCKSGTDVLVAADGKVSSLADNPDGYGKMVSIDHGNGYVTRYAQLSSFKVKEGDKVKKGDIIALSGNSGQSTAPHLHYEIIKDGEHINPMSLIEGHNLRKADKVVTDKQGHTPAVLPLKNTKDVRMTSGFGRRMHPIEKVMKNHKGMDFSCPKGTEVIATADGKVVAVKTFDGGYGKLITISHGDTYQTRYAQLSQFKVKEGDEVKKGDVIALSGSSGASTAPHLHYEVLQDNKHVDPIHYIKDYNFIAKMGRQEEQLAAQEKALAEQEIILAEQEKAQMQQERILAEQEQMNALEEEKNAQQEILLIEREAMLQQREQERNQEMQQATSQLQLERENEERRLIELQILNEKLQLGDDKQYQRIEFDGSGGSPLFVVDGEVVNEISNLAPDEIKEVTVLKGKSATEKYGDKASDGVVEIYTKDKEKSKQKRKNKEKSKNKIKQAQAVKFSRSELLQTQRALSQLGYLYSTKITSPADR